MSHFAGCDVRMEDAMNLKLLNFFHYLDVLIDGVHQMGFSVEAFRQGFVDLIYDELLN